MMWICIINPHPSDMYTSSSSPRCFDTVVHHLHLSYSWCTLYYSIMYCCYQLVLQYYVLSLAEHVLQSSYCDYEYQPLPICSTLRSATHHYNRAPRQPSASNVSASLFSAACFSTTQHTRQFSAREDCSLPPIICRYAS